MGNGCGMVDLLRKTGLGCQKSHLSTDNYITFMKMHSYCSIVGIFDRLVEYFQGFLGFSWNKKDAECRVDQPGPIFKA